MPVSRRDLMVSLGSLTLTGSASAQTGGDRPNVLYVILEDTGPNYGCYGEPLVKTPNFDRLAEQGTRFTHAFCTAPVCSASRSALMSGRYQNNIGAHNHRTWDWNKRRLEAPAKHICDWSS